MKAQHWFYGLLLAAMIAFGCSKNSTGPDDAAAELAETEQIAMIAMEVAEADGGLMADLRMTSTNATGSLGKTAGFDTTITKSWVTYKLSLKFYTARGSEQNRFVKGVTDSLTYQSTLSGSRADNARGSTINLNSGSALNATDIKSGVILVNGAGVNNSTYGLAGNKRNLTIAAASAYVVRNVVVNTQSGSYIPTSGTIEGTLKGKFTVAGGKNGSEKNYSFTFTLTFNGNNQVTVTLPNGKQFTLNLVTGQFH